MTKQSTFRRESAQQIRGRRSGFTLLEILIVLAIILVIAAMVVPNVMGTRKQANIDITMASVKALEKAVKMYATQRGGEYPDGGQEVLEQLIVKSEYRGRNIDPILEEVPLDAWGEKLYYQYPGDKFEHLDKPAIWSSGPDKQDDGGENDDINNWTMHVDEIVRRCEFWSAVAWHFGVRWPGTALDFFRVFEIHPKATFATDNSLDRVERMRSGNQKSKESKAVPGHRTPKCRTPKRAGVTLLELLLVLAVLLAVAGMSFPSLNSVFKERALRENADAVRELLAQGRLESVDAAIVYQFRYEPGGREFVLIPFERNDASGDEVDSNVLRVYSGRMDEGILFRIPEGQTGQGERLSSEWFGALPDAGRLADVTWSLPILFFPDGTAIDGRTVVANERGELITLSVRGLTASVSVSEIQSDESV